jgi:HPt (histidine-containing phosphotransfer) domain-containing protein
LAAHSLKSGAATLGATRLSECAREIEAAGAQQTLAPAAALLTELDARHRSAVHRLRDLIGTPT